MGQPNSTTSLSFYAGSIALLRTEPDPGELVYHDARQDERYIAFAHQFFERRQDDVSLLIFGCVYPDTCINQDMEGRLADVYGRLRLESSELRLR